MASLKQIDNSIYWQEHVIAQTRDSKQKRRCQEAVLRLMQERMEIVREMQERELDKGIAEHAAWYDTSAELR